MTGSRARWTRFVLGSAAAFLAASGASGAVDLAKDAWPQFRGPNASGVAPLAHPPIKISPTNDVLWAIDVPWAPSSPCVWGDRIFLTTALNGELQTRAYDAQTGALLWSKGVIPKNFERYHPTENSPASASPATDGRRVVSYFGSFGVIAYDPDGRELWRHPFPLTTVGGGFGSGASPIIAGDAVILNRDQDENSSVVALRLDTGETLWETPRPEAFASFGTPVVWHKPDTDEVIIPGSLRLKAYDLKTGRERWSFEGVAAFSCTTPVVGQDLLYFAGWAPGKGDWPWATWESFLDQFDLNKDGEITFQELPASNRDFMRGLDTNHDGKITKSDWETIAARNAKGQNAIVAIKPGAPGDPAQAHLAWKFTRGLPYVASPLLYQGRIYTVKDGGMLSCFDAESGAVQYLEERLNTMGSYYASPVAADDRIYLASVNGQVTVVKAGGATPEILHQAQFGDRIFATPALVGNRLYLRTHDHLYAFGK